MSLEGAKPTLSVVIPALNEEGHVAQAVAEVIKAVEGRCFEYEILLFNDGSTDRTGAVMEELAKGNPCIRVFHNEKPLNTGGVFELGVAKARYEYVMMVPGDNENPSDALVGPVEAIGQADVVIPYNVNQQDRPWMRRVLSRIYTASLNILFRLNLKYYNGTAIYRTQDLKSIQVRTTSFAHLAERLIKLLRKGCSYVEVGIRISPPKGRRSKAFRFKNLVGVGKAVFQLLIEEYGSGALRIRT